MQSARGSHGGARPTSAGFKARRPWVLAAVAVAVAAALALTAAPLHALALEFQALADSLRTVVYEGPFVPDAWIPWGRWFLRLGALPLLALAVTAGLLRAARAARLDAGIPGDLPASARGALALAAGLPFLAFVPPFSLALASWLLVETLPWVQWYDHLERLAEPLVWATAPVLALGTFAGGALVLAASLRAPAGASPRSRGLRRVLGIAALAGLLLLAAAPVSVLALHGARALPAAGNVGTLERRCSSCHSPTAPLFYVKSPDEWRHFLETTCFPRAGLHGEEPEEILSFVTATRSFSDAWVFRTRCQRCHAMSAIGWRDRLPADWEGLVARVARDSPFLVDRAAQAQIVRHLSRERSDVPGDLELATRKAAAVAACTGCHFFSRHSEAWADATQEQALELARRMNGRMVHPLSEEALRSAAEVWRAAVRDPSGLKDLVPHDRPARQGDLPW
jgi:hypothetical protein